MKVVFLDIDGVLNTSKLIRSFGGDHIDPVLTALFARIVKETDSKIVLSSTWRIETRNKLLVEAALAQHGLELFGSTPVIKREWPEWTQRRDEISAWLEGNEVDKFAIIDDFPDAEIEGSFFQTDEKIGLTAEMAEKVILHLGQT
jgi:hypothetical protein